MREYERIRAAIIRGGTSKGVYLLASDLPKDPAVRDQVILAIYGYTGFTMAPRIRDDETRAGS